MAAPISIVIPTLNSADHIAPLLSDLAQGMYAGLIKEVIFADGGSSDDIKNIADATGAELVEAPRGRGKQLRAGASVARGAWLLFLHSDSALGEDWIAGVSAHLKTSKAGYFRLAFDEHGLPPKLVAGWANLRSRFAGLPYGDQGLLISRALYDDVGGFDAIPLMEDVAMARKLRGHMRVIDATLTTSADKYRAQGWLTRGGKNLILLLRYLFGASPEALAKRYMSKR